MSGRIDDYENYYDIDIRPMNKKGEPTDGEVRQLYLHKDFIKRLFEVVDELKNEEWQHKSTKHVGDK